MHLSPATRLGPYEIVSALGAGGMGEVYRATDTNLRRQVAIKVLPEAVASDPERLVRFQREAEVLAALNHPNIAQVYGLEDAGGTKALVMELVEGPTLADRIAQGPIPVEQALPLAKQIAEALKAAHEQGIIHRDLKPANIKVRPDGTVKVLDFGLAKTLEPAGAVSPGLSQSPTITTPAMTQAGIILGTAAYMAPEQASGGVADRRADIWAFGVVLFEMLTGRALFTGKTVSHVLADVLRVEPEWRRLPPTLHPRIRLLLERCLEKEAADRYHDIADARADIVKALADPHGFASTPSAPTARTSRAWVPWLVAPAVTLAISGLALWFTAPDEPERPITRFEIELPDYDEGLFTLSPDGRRLVYGSEGGLRLRSLDQLEATSVAGSEEGREPFFSPDGRSLAFFTPTQLKRMALPDGLPEVVADTRVEGLAGVWGADGRILFGRSGSFSLSQVPATGGVLTTFAELGDAADVDYADILPGGQWAIFTEVDDTRRGWSQGNIVAQSVATGERRLLVEGGHFARYAPTGHLVYARNGRLLAVGFDPDTLTVLTQPVVMVEGVATVETGGLARYTFSQNGTLAFLPAVSGTIGRGRTLAMVTPGGTVDRLDLTPKEYTNPRVSPDGRRLVVQSVETEGNTLWIYDLARGGQIRQLTFGGDNQYPIWTPDGRRITFASDRNGSMSLYEMPADGGPAEQLTNAEEGVSHYPGTWSPDGGTLLFMVERDRNLDWDIWRLSPGAEAVSAYDAPDTIYIGPEFSPDGRWLAYVSGAQVGNGDVFVEPFPATGRRERITPAGGFFPVWSAPGGDRLFYRPVADVVQRLRSVDIQTAPDFTFSSEETLPMAGFVTVGFHRDYDVVPGSDRFLMVYPSEVTDAEKGLPTRVQVVLNWFEELKARVPVP